ncbi:hypothetical protein HDU84_002107 [Entophlyctis sp. JEL0112]|nr:hypothetical protein HDU84_002107 [Entophlyctis sp. JEL0112]
MLSFPAWMKVDVENHRASESQISAALDFNESDSDDAKSTDGAEEGRKGILFDTLTKEAFGKTVESSSIPLVGSDCESEKSELLFSDNEVDENILQPWRKRKTNLDDSTSIELSELPERLSTIVNGKRDQPQDHRTSIPHKEFYGDQTVTTEYSDRSDSRKFAKAQKQPSIRFDDDGEPTFEYPASSDDEYTVTRVQSRNVNSETDEDDPSKPRLFRKDPHYPKELPIVLPTGDRKRAPSKAEIDAKRHRELVQIAQRMKKEIQARRVTGITEQKDVEPFGESSCSTVHGPVYSKKEVYLFMPTDGRRWRTAIDSDGRRLYFPIKSRSSLSSIAAGTPVNRLDLLGTNIHVMLRKIEDDAVSEAAEARARLRISAQVGEKNALEFFEDQLGDSDSNGNERDAGKLWVNKFAPKSYVDLIGDERINREVMTWVKQWDYCVFKKPLPRKPDEEKSWKTSKPDPFHRPEKKVLLLSGPAGLGKTTLAHIIGRHAGYNIIEVNASDDRTGDSMRNKVISAIESQSLNSSKPNLVIIDEIDGASSGGGDAGFVQMLVDLATDSSDAKNNRKGSKGGPSKKRALLRPVICICNDQYAAVLRPLRAIAQCFSFRTPPHRLLAARLNDICKTEGMQADLRTLMALCELTDGDIRSSLNTLQFLRRKSRILTIDMLRSVAVGHKDMTRGLFKVWEEIFTIPSAKKMKRIIQVFDGNDSDADANRYINRLLHLISASGEVDRILQGCFENYLKLPIIDIAASSTKSSRSTTRIEQALEWMLFHDKLDKFILVDRDFDLLKYQPFTVVNFYRLFAGVSKPKIEFPRGDYEAFINKKSKETIALTVMSNISLPDRVTWGSHSRIVEELVTPLMAILKPDFRAVNLNLLKDSEKRVLHNLVDVMVTFGLKFVQEKGEDGHYSFRMSPPLDDLLVGKRIGEDSQSQYATYPVKQLIAKEIETESIRRVASPIGSGISRSRNVQPDKPAEKEIITQPVLLSNLMATKRIAPGPAVLKDFFGRPIKPPEDKYSQKENERKSPAVKMPVVNFKYNEGFTNAVRKPMKIRDFTG